MNGFRFHRCGPRAASSLLGVLLLASGARGGEPVTVPNPEFREGRDTPDRWVLSGGRGRWVDREVLEVAGDGEDSNHWRLEGLRFPPASLHHFRMRARRIGGAGTVVSGPAFANRDFRAIREDWHGYGFVFRTPDSGGDHAIRLGQWHSTGTVQFDAATLRPVLPVHRRVRNLLLGEGEAIHEGRYSFHGTFQHAGSNFHRVLHRATAGFNSDRWVFGGGSEVVYRFGLPGHRMRSGRVSIAVSYHVRGACQIDASRDGESWQPLFHVDRVGQGEATLPAALVPAPEIFLRLRTTGQSSSFQVNRVEFEADLDGDPPEGGGETRFASVEETSPDLAVEEICLEGDPQSGPPVLTLTAKNRRPRATRIRLAASVSRNGASRGEGPEQVSPTSAGGSTRFQVPLRVTEPGVHRVAVRVGPEEGRPVRLSLEYELPEYYRADYGWRIRVGSPPTSPVAVWYCRATHKVPPRRALPLATADAARLSAARNDHEAVQIVVQALDSTKPGAGEATALRGLRASATPLRGPDQAVIPAEEVSVLRVAYHSVRHPTDATGVRGRWPDALPPLRTPVDVPRGENQPLWILVHVPRDARAGDYSGEVLLEADGWRASVPLRLHVWDFALPERNHIETAFGLTMSDIYRYHGLRTEADKRRVLDLYFRSFSEHRISPYDPTPLDPIRVRFRPESSPPAAEVDFSAFDVALSRAVESYHFTNLRLPIQGMGGGTFHARYEPRIGRFDAETAEYQQMFSSYVGQIENHLREKGWLDMAYIYWFDEPAPRDYDFVIEGMKRLKKYAPGLNRMLTEEPGDELAGWVDIWCPVSHNYDHAPAEKRRARGERLWWYVCTGPKAPYCTLFIDHPATELRVWLWQTWKRNIVGILVWRANYWTSGAAFPDQPQNPYQDPMGYVSGYSTPRGTKRHWGNGDGRFIYPPEAAAVPGASGPGPVIEPPVSSIRWEMLREGIEDYEFLYRLRELVAERRGRLSPAQVERYEKLLEVPEAISRGRTEFTVDPAPIYEHRARVAAAIEELAR